jgi:hypothetical protein
MNPFLMQLTGQAENRFYGHVHLLAKYCGIEGSPWINGYLQHGWNATDGFGNYMGSRRLANKFVWSKRCEESIKKSGLENTYAIGAPWIYLPDVYPLETYRNRTGVIAYPAHSSTWSSMGDTSKEYAKHLKDNYGKVTVVIHRYDYANKQIRSSYESMGHNVITHGNGTPWETNFNPMFLKDQREILSKFSIAVSNTMSTPILYATQLGLKAEISGPVDYSVTDPDDASSQIGDGSTDWNNLLNNKQDLFFDELGVSSKKTPSELKDLFGWTPKPHKTVNFLLNRTRDLVSGSNWYVAKEVFKSKYQKN